VVVVNGCWQGRFRVRALVVRGAAVVALVLAGSGLKALDWVRDVFAVLSRKIMWVQRGREFAC
jgi:hypothetical protein